MDSEHSVEFYAKATLKMPVFFPHGKADCRHCRFCRFRDAFGLYQCSLTDGLVEKYELDGRHMECPIEFEEVPF